MVNTCGFAPFTAHSTQAQAFTVRWTRAVLHLLLHPAHRQRPLLCSEHVQFCTFDCTQHTGTGLYWVVNAWCLAPFKAHSPNTINHVSKVGSFELDIRTFSISGNVYFCVVLEELTLQPLFSPKISSKNTRWVSYGGDWSGIWSRVV